jgi:hypothetical protein
MIFVRSTIQLPPAKIPLRSGGVSIQFGIPPKSLCRAEVDSSANFHAWTFLARSSRARAFGARSGKAVVSDHLRSSSYGASANLARSRHSGATAERLPYLRSKFIRGFGYDHGHSNRRFDHRSNPIRSRICERRALLAIRCCRSRDRHFSSRRSKPEATRRRESR